MSDSPSPTLAFSRTDDGFWRLQASQWVPQPLETVFAFFHHPANLSKITPPQQKMRIREPFPERMSPGDVFTYRLQVLGIPLVWKARIDTVTPPHSFTDTMLKGPYRAWIHTHRFEALRDGTLISDDVKYKIYGCSCGHKTFFKPQLTKIFTARARQVAEFFGA
jgi:uncharacterized protein